jgi:hypothetical protein
MAGYMAKLSSYLYEGELVNGAQNAVPNGILMVQNGDALELPAADSTSKFVCKEITDIYGDLGYRFVIDKLNKRYYFVETSEEDFYALPERDGRAATFAPGELLRAHPVQVGEEFIVSGAANQYAVGTAYGVLATGEIG